MHKIYGFINKAAAKLIVLCYTVITITRQRKNVNVFQGETKVENPVYQA
jgi:hypothetical protein